MLTKEAEYQMNLRGVVSDKQQLITVLEQAYRSVNSEAEFYKKLRKQKLELYSRNNKVVGVVLKRKYRFTTLGYDRLVLKALDKDMSEKKRMQMLERIREKQQMQRDKGNERARKRGR